VAEILHAFPPAFVESSKPTMSAGFALADGSLVGLAYWDFVAGHLSREEGGDVMLLEFTFDLIRVRGRNLRAAYKAFCDGRGYELREGTPEEGLIKSLGETHIDKIEIIERECGPETPGARHARWKWWKRNCE